MIFTSLMLQFIKPLKYKNLSYTVYEIYNFLLKNIRFLLLTN